MWPFDKRNKQPHALGDLRLTISADPVLNDMVRVTLERIEMRLMPVPHHIRPVGDVRGRITAGVSRQPVWVPVITQLSPSTLLIAGELAIKQMRSDVMRYAHRAGKL